ncbi:pentapeptide repeat-containing protein [Aneurinibacillus thermoaerophilus]|uniref:pentapeptide repeat-containing protein n=1 Tax=Aneurinibacillus thermoaerophilus TaxID=143495 RepID=UPI002E1DA3A0|nr:pentapeptide repeat-containing protein [Aneurinibacillus thermoaerophilus]MED0766276.1 pentapeptide repeat-containing protein [Aneurinibacillus thermoaerophilus]
MEKEEALQHFIKNEAIPRITESLLALEDYFQTHKDTLVHDFIHSFQHLCHIIKERQEQGEKGKIGYITYSMLRTEIMEERSIYGIEATDSRWFFYPKACQAEYDAGWAFFFLDELENELEKARKAYMGEITKLDIEKLKLKEAAKYHQYVISLARYAMPQAVLLPAYLEIEKEEELEIRVGEYRDLSEVVYKEDARIKDAETMKEWLEEKEEYAYAYEVFSHLDLSYGEYEGIDLRYANMKQSNLSHSTLCGCTLIGTAFTLCDLEEADLSYSLIHEADFSQSNLKGAMFREVEGSSGLLDPSSWDMPGFMSVSFIGANLEGADFTRANLKGAVFVGANLTATNFTGANLERAIFSMEDMEKVELDDIQRESVIWKA